MSTHEATERWEAARVLLLEELGPGSSGARAGEREILEKKLFPVAVLWRERWLWVSRINAEWRDRSLRPHRYGFSVTAENGEIFQLRYEEGNPVWRLECVPACDMT
jgi:hypothetical protein